MKIIFKNIKLFTFYFLVLIFIDVFLIANNNLRPFRLISKPIILFMLIAFYAINNNDKVKKNIHVTIGALLCFIIASITNYFYNFFWLVIASSIFFIIGKVFYAVRFSNNKDFNFKTAIPFLLFFLIYMFVFLTLILENLGNLFILILTFLFVTLLGILFALLRKNNVNRKSYVLVLLGMILLLCADSISVLTAFYKYWNPEKYVTMILYTIAQYFIIIGLVKESREIECF